MEIRVARSRAANLEQHLTRPRLGHRYVPKLARLLPFDELEGLDFVTSFLPVASLA
jgi:hypothetical protein